MSDHESVFEDLRVLLQDPDRGGTGDLELRRSGRTVHWTAQPTRDAAGGTVGFTLTLSDVTHERQVSQMKTDFVSFVTHQLRTPLAGIKWMLELAAQTPQVPAEAGSYVEDARAAAERLIGLVNDLLDISRLESGKLTVTLQPMSLAEAHAEHARRPRAADPREGPPAIGGGRGRRGDGAGRPAAAPAR